jgi:hypothetical protein
MQFRGAANSRCANVNLHLFFYEKFERGGDVDGISVGSARNITTRKKHLREC